ncbi:MAG: GYD domain-containing protein [Gemmatimonadota bacterium]
MAYYLFQAAYTTEAWAAQLKNPQNRVERVRSALEELGGTIEDAWLSFGEYDVLVICQAPDRLTQAAFAMAAAAAGHLKSVKTTPLLTIDEGMAAMQKAGAVAYPLPES